MLSDATVETLDKNLAKKYKTLNIPGMAMVITQHGKTIYKNFLGYRDNNKQLPITKDTIFGVASITKSLTALAVMQLRDACQLNIEDKVTTWLPELTLPREDYLSHLEIHHLMSHTSGLPGLSLMNNARSASIQSDPDGDYLFGSVPRFDHDVIQTPDDLIKKIGETDFTLLGRPGDVFNYSNEGFGILQAIIERASGMSFINYAKKHIFAPLNMNNSYFRTRDIMNLDNITELYAYKKNGKEIFHSPAWWDTGEIYTNGSLKTSPADLMKYMEVYRLNGLVNGEYIVSEQSVKEMTTPTFALPNGGYYGYGIEVNDSKTISHFGHSGSIKGVSANFQVNKEKDITACLLINMADVPAEELLLSSLKRILNLPDNTSASSKSSYKPIQRNLDEFAGFYQSAENHELTVKIRNNKLVLKMENQNIPISPVSEYDFITPEGDNYHFTIRDDQVTGIYVGKRFIPKVS